MLPSFVTVKTTFSAGPGWRDLLGGILAPACLMEGGELGGSAKDVDGRDAD